jgi:hypothetical protein
MPGHTNVKLLKFVCTIKFWLKDHNTKENFIWRPAKNFYKRQ